MQVGTKLLAALGLPEDTLPVDETAGDTRVLDAALELIGDIGEHRLTMDDVARQAKVGRRTLFRRFGSRDALLTRVYQREVVRAVTRIGDAADAESDGLDALVAAFVALVEHSDRHPVIRRLARAEPETLVELWRTGSPSGREMGLMLLHSVAVQLDHGLTAPQLRQVTELLIALLFAEQLLPQDPRSLDVRDRAVVRRLVVACADTTPR